MIIRRIVLHIVLVVCCLYPQTMLHASGKPEPPIVLLIAPADSIGGSKEVRADDTIAFVVKMTARIDVEKLNLMLHCRNGAQFVSGASTWEGRLSKNESASITLFVKASAQGRGSIIAELSMPSSGGAGISTRSEYQLGVSAKKQKGSAYKQKKDGGGRRLIEYR